MYSDFQQYLTICEKVLTNFINFEGQGMAALTDLPMAVDRKWDRVETWYWAILFIIMICNTGVSFKKIWEPRGGSGPLFRGMTQNSSQESKQRPLKRGLMTGWELFQISQELMIMEPLLQQRQIALSTKWDMLDESLCWSHEKWKDKGWTYQGIPCRPYL